jgi:hypothetical protein
MTFVPPPLAVQQINSGLIYTFFADPNRAGRICGAGITAQAWGESAYEPSAVGDHDDAVGLWQMWPVRRDAIAKGIGITITPTTPLVSQCEAAWWELTEGAEQAALRAILATKTAYDAGVAACVAWMRPKAPDNRVARGNTATTLYARFNPNAPS